MHMVRIISVFAIDDITHILVVSILVVPLQQPWIQNKSYILKDFTDLKECNNRLCNSPIWLIISLIPFHKLTINYGPGPEQFSV